MSGQRQHYELCLSEMTANFLMEGIKKIYIKPTETKIEGLSFVGPVLSLDHWPNKVCPVAYLYLHSASFKPCTA